MKKILSLLMIVYFSMASLVHADTAVYRGPLYGICVGPCIEYTTTLDAASGNQIAYSLNYITNKAAGNDTGLKINMTDTASPGISYLLEMAVNGTTQYYFKLGALFSFGVGTSIYLQSTDNTNEGRIILTQMTSGSAANWIRIRPTSIATSGTNIVLGITPTYNQTSGTASNYDFQVNRTETAIGSGTQRFASLGKGGTSYVEYWGVDNLGTQCGYFATNVDYKIGRGTSDTDITFIAMRNASGTQTFCYPNAAGDGITCSTTAP